VVTGIGQSISIWQTHYSKHLHKKVLRESISDGIALVAGAVALRFVHRRVVDIYLSTDLSIDFEKSEVARMPAS